MPKCPTCNSERIEKISGSSKVGGAVLFGLFALGHISKTFKCDNCGYKW
jgi:transposase-like protein